jgi:hypothetical protein
MELERAVAAECECGAAAAGQHLRARGVRGFVVLCALDGRRHKQPLALTRARAAGG